MCRPLSGRRRRGAASRRPADAGRHYGHDPAVQPYHHDLAKARALLSEAGYGTGLTLVFDIPTTHPDEAPRLAELMAEQYDKVSVTVQVKTFDDRPAYAEMVKAKRIDDACCFDSSPLSTWRVLREKFHAGVRGAWWQGYGNSEVDALLDQAVTVIDTDRRQALYRRAYRLIRDDAPWIFLYSPKLAWGRKFYKPVTLSLALMARSASRSFPSKSSSESGTGTCARHCARPVGGIAKLYTLADSYYTSGETSDVLWFPSSERKVARWPSRSP